jgi:cell division protein FtsB
MRIQPLQRRRKPILPKLLLALLLLFLGWLVWLGTRSYEVPTQKIEQDVTNEALAG